jgi:hypothetical protein
MAELPCAEFVGNPSDPRLSPMAFRPEAQAVHHVRSCSPSH